MAILARSMILRAIEADEIKIDPFVAEHVGPNSYDVRLSPHLAVFDRVVNKDPFRRINTNRPRGPEDNKRPLDARVPPTMVTREISDQGFVIYPGRLYLGSTLEYTESHRHLPYLDGCSSAGRLGISIHVTAGRGDVGFCNHWTMEITCVEPVRIYAGMRIGQLTWHEVTGDPGPGYQRRAESSYAAARDPLPQASRMAARMERDAFREKCREVRQQSGHVGETDYERAVRVLGKTGADNRASFQTEAERNAPAKRRPARCVLSEGSCKAGDCPDHGLFPRRCTCDHAGPNPLCPVHGGLAL